MTSLIQLDPSYHVAPVVAQMPSLLLAPLYSQEFWRMQKRPWQMALALAPPLFLPLQALELAEKVLAKREWHLLSGPGRLRSSFLGLELMELLVILPRSFHLWKHHSSRRHLLQFPSGVAYLARHG
jgi:hypothetical protein